MTEILVRGDQKYDPLINYGSENYPPIPEQKEFFRCAFLEGAAVEKPSRVARGPLFDEFVTVLHEVDSRISDVDPTFTAECIVPYGYQSRMTRALLQDIDQNKRRALGKIAEFKTTTLQAILQSEKGESLRNQQLPLGIVDVPHYAQQKEDWKSFNSARSCTNACFRMVFGTIAGWMPSQAAISECLESQHGTSIVDDLVYSAIYHTEVFREICPKQVVTIELIGADFESIERMGTHMKKKQPKSEFYCTVSLASKTEGNNVWHSCVLLGVESGVVTYHDPLNKNGGAYYTTPIENFLERWSIAYNRALITIAV